MSLGTGSGGVGVGVGLGRGSPGGRRNEVGSSVVIGLISADKGYINRVSHSLTDGASARADMRMRKTATGPSIRSRYARSGQRPFLVGTWFS